VGFSEGEIHFDSTWLAYKLDENKEICCVLYFQKTFDDVPHRRHVYGKTETALFAYLIVTRPSSYLTKHQQSVVINGGSSLSISGVPHDLVLGLLPFLIFIDSISTSF